MDSTIVAAFVSGVLAIVAPIVTLLLKQYLDNRVKLPIAAGRRQALSGRWEGSLHQDRGPDGKPIDFPGSIDISAGRKTVSGTLTIRLDLDGQIEQAKFNLSGGFLHGVFLLLNYLPRDEATIQFGSIVLELDAAGNLLEGRFVGYGKITQAVISGTVRFEKAK